MLNRKDLSTLFHFPESSVPAAAPQGFFAGTEAAQWVTDLSQIAVLRGNDEGTIAVYAVEVTDSRRLYDICESVYRQAAQPCLLILCCQGRWLLSALCRGTGPKKEQTILISQCLFPDYTTRRAASFLAAVNADLNSDKSAADMYAGICDQLQKFPLGGDPYISDRRHFVDYVAFISASVSGSNISRRTALSLKKQVILWPVHKKAALGGDAEEFDPEDFWYFLQHNKTLQAGMRKWKFYDLEDFHARYIDWAGICDLEFMEEADFSVYFDYEFEAKIDSLVEAEEKEQRKLPPIPEYW